MKKTHAVVIGGGIAGLATAKVLSDYYRDVTVLEKDTSLGSESPRSGAAQGAHLHILLQRGLELLSVLFPGIKSELEDCPVIDWAQDTFWENAYGQFPRYASEIKLPSLSRPLLEKIILDQVSKIPNIKFNKMHFQSFKIEGARAVQVQSVEGLEVQGDAFFLAGGQSLPVERILSPSYVQTESIPIDITYRSVVFETQSLRMDDFKQYYYQLSPKYGSLGGVICPVENGRSIATVIEANSNESGRIDLKKYMELSARVPGSRFFKVIKNGFALSDVSVFCKKTQFRRRFSSDSRGSRIPENIFLVGDALCSFNPVFGQGMTVALNQALILKRLLDQNALNARVFHKRSIKSTYFPYVLSKLGSSSEEGMKENYVRSFLKKAQQSKKAHHRFLKGLHLTGSLGSLIDPLLLVRLAITSVKTGKNL